VNQAANVVAIQQRARRALIVGGMTKWKNGMLDFFHRFNIDPVWHWEMEKVVRPGVTLPPGCDLVLIFDDMAGGIARKAAHESAQAAGVKCIHSMRQKPGLERHLRDAGFVPLAPAAPEEAEPEEAAQTTREQLVDRLMEIAAQLAEPQADPRVAVLEAEVALLKEENAALAVKAAKYDKMREALG
jgi:hypothetical protein